MASVSFADNGLRSAWQHLIGARRFGQSHHNSPSWPESGRWWRILDMRRRRQEIAVLALILILLVSDFTPHGTAALGDTSVTATDCSIAAARDAINNKVTCNYGL